MCLSGLLATLQSPPPKGLGEGEGAPDGSLLRAHFSLPENLSSVPSTHCPYSGSPHQGAQSRHDPTCFPFISIPVIKYPEKRKGNLGEKGFIQLRILGHSPSQRDKLRHKFKHLIPSHPQSRAERMDTCLLLNSPALRTQNPDWGGRGGLTVPPIVDRVFPNQLV